MGSIDAGNEALLARVHGPGVCVAVLQLKSHLRNAQCCVVQRQGILVPLFSGGTLQKMNAD